MGSNEKLVFSCIAATFLLKKGFNRFSEPHSGDIIMPLLRSSELVTIQ